MFERFHEVVKNRHQYAREWKERTGGKVVGYFCCYTPEEILYAAGILPVRIVGGLEPTDPAEPYLHCMFCPFCRDCLSQGLTGKYDYLDGIVMAQSCLHIHQTFDSWRMHLPINYSYYIFMPTLIKSPHAKANLVAELSGFKDSLEKWTGKEISDEALDVAIDIYNSNRRLMREIYELRKGDELPLSGVEAMEIVLSSMFMDKKEHNALLREVKKRLPGRGDRAASGPRLMIAGGEIHNPEVLRIIEESGANIVIDELCMGTRYFWNMVPSEDDRLCAIATRYLEKPSCPLKDGLSRSRLNYIARLIEDYRVQGAFLFYEKFCDPHEFDIPHMEELFKKKDIPNYFIELDVTLPAGQIRTRAEAFLEMLDLEL
ncbi:MAG: 2-hydroxyacyl-CoA dehydratase [Thermodesulfobacteriota bacterium]|nr:2-hydroxyacyl-CoA dehydratase [Thermodesulfobacteriota bacterium]